MTLYEIEKIAILEALALHEGNRTHTAKYLDIGLRTLQRKLKDYADTGVVIPFWKMDPRNVTVVTNF